MIGGSDQQLVLLLPRFDRVLEPTGELEGRGRQGGWSGWSATSEETVADAERGNGCLCRLKQPGLRFHAENLHTRETPKLHVSWKHRLRLGQQP